MSVKPAEVEARTADVLHGMQEVVGTVIPESLTRARAAVDDAIRQYLERVPALEHELAGRAQRVERHAAKLARRLPVDTPLDRRRRRQNRRRGATVLVAMLGVGGVAAFLVWRARHREDPSPAEQPLDPRATGAAGPGAPASDGDVAAARGAS